MSSKKKKTPSNKDQNIEKKESPTKIQKPKKEKQDESKEEKVIFKSDVKKEEKTEEKIEKKEVKQAEKVKAEILEDTDNKKRKMGAVVLLLTIVLVIILIFSTIFAMIHSMKNTIAKGVKIKNIDVSGLTYNEAKNKLKEAFKTVDDVNIDLSYKDYNYKIKPEDIEFSYNFQKELDEAYSIGRKGNIIRCNFNLIATAFLEKNIDFEYKYNKDVVNSIVEEISTGIPGLVSQYSYYIDGNNLIINPGKDGIQVEKEKLLNKIESSLKNRNPLEIIKDFKNCKIDIPIKEVKTNQIDMDKIYNEVHCDPKNAYYTPATETEKTKIYTDVDGIDFAISVDEAKAKLSEETNEYIIPLNRKKADVTINDIGLEAFPSKLQEFSTRFDASNYGRSENLRIATSKINGTVLMPGEQFSFNGVVGERTIQAGYKNAAIYEGDSVVDGLAGGICQVSSTLYNVALLSNLQIDERYNHSFKASYLECGRDATVVYGIKDLKFTNSRTYPIKIEGNAENGVVTFSIYGIEEEEEYKVNIIPVITATTPFNVKTVTDYSLEPGKQVVKQLGMSGYRSITYKEKVLNGTVVSKEVISNDIYKSMDRIINAGPELSPTDEQ